MNSFQELRQKILSAIEAAGDDPRKMGEPSKGQVFELSKLWNDIAGPYYAEFIGLDGWKRDWMRAAKHTFIESCIALAYPGERLNKSTDIPREAYELIILYVEAKPPAVVAWLALHEENILERANILMIEAFNHHLNRAPVLAAEDLPNLQGPTPAYVSATQATEELFDL